MTAVSSGTCPGCTECASDEACTLTELRVRWEAGETIEEPHFSSQPCGVCNSHFAGDRYVWHALDSKNNKVLYHFNDMCTDCVLYLANGDEPDRWEN